MLLAKVIFLHVFVILFIGGGCLLQIFGGGGQLQLLQIFGGGGMSAPNFNGGGFLQFSEYGHRSAGTHPTGMHSCQVVVFYSVS